MLAVGHKLVPCLGLAGHRAAALLGHTFANRVWKEDEFYLRMPIVGHDCWNQKDFD